jgi:hypothetical protein
VEGGAQGECSVGVDGVIALVDKADDALLIDDNIGAKSPLVVFVFDAVRLQDAVSGEHLVVHVAEQREVKAVLLCEGGIGRRTIQADAEDLGIRSGDPTGVDADLDGAHLFGTAFGEGENINGEEDILLAAVVAEPDGFPVISKEREIRRMATNFERHTCDLRFVYLVSERRSSNGSNQQQNDDEGTFHKDSRTAAKLSGQQPHPAFFLKTSQVSKIFPGAETILYLRGPAFARA